MFTALFNSQYQHLMVITPKGSIVDKYNERVPKANLLNVPCKASGSNSGRTSEQGENLSLSYTVQLSNCPEVFVGDKIPELKTCQGQILFKNGQVQRVSPLIDGNLGIIAQTLSVSIQK